MMFRTRKNNSNLLVGTIIGGCLGAAGALLLAPKTGKELREDLMEQARISGERTRRLSETMMEMGSEWTMDLANEPEKEQEEAQLNHTEQAKDSGTVKMENDQERDGGDIGYVIKEVLEDTDIYEKEKK